MCSRAGASAAHENARVSKQQAAAAESAKIELSLQLADLASRVNDDVTDSGSIAEGIPHSQTESASQLGRSSLQQGALADPDGLDASPLLSDSAHPDSQAPAAAAAVLPTAGVSGGGISDGTSSAISPAALQQRFLPPTFKSPH